MTMKAESIDDGHATIPPAFWNARDPHTVGAQGDAIPFFHAGRYHLFYLSSPVGETELPARARTCWRHLVSDDLVRWEEEMVALPLGKEGDPDTEGIWTGSVIHANERFHVFYTAAARGSSFPQTICHAVSDDLVHFVKDINNPILTPRLDMYEPQDWRDPFVFWNDEEGCFWMLIAARIRSGPPGRRGAVALATSPDLVQWHVEAPLYAPGSTYCPECPEIFRLGDRWRLVYSRFSESPGTIYRDADYLRGPWRTPVVDRWDGGRWYAAKSLTDDRGRRIAFGWTHDRRGLTDTGEWLWAGDMDMPREIYPRSDGTLGIRLPAEILNSFSEPLPVALRAVAGDWQSEEGAVVGRGVAGLALAALELPTAADSSRPQMIECTITPRDIAGSVGMVLQTSEALDRGLGVIVQPARDQIALVEWPTGQESDRQKPPLVEHWLPLSATQSFTLQCLLRGSVLEVFFDGRVALTHRIYAPGSTVAGLFVQDDDARFVVAHRSWDATG